MRHLTHRESLLSHRLPQPPLPILSEGFLSPEINSQQDRQPNILKGRGEEGGQKAPTHSNRTWQVRNKHRMRDGWNKDKVKREVYSAGKHPGKHGGHHMSHWAKLTATERVPLRKCLEKKRRNQFATNRPSFRKGSSSQAKARPVQSKPLPVLPAAAGSA